MENKIWYACYGSNLLEERLLKAYILGGDFNGHVYKGCTDKTLPSQTEPFEFKGKLYFAKNSSKWEYGGVAFVLMDDPAETMVLSRLYLITKEQFAEIKTQEGGWYRNEVHLGLKDGIEIKTFTNEEEINPKVKPCAEYLRVIKDGLRQTHPSFTPDDVYNYLKDIEGIKGEYNTEELKTILQ